MVKVEESYPHWLPYMDYKVDDLLWESVTQDNLVLAFMVYTLCLCQCVEELLRDYSLPNWQLVKTKNKSESKIKSGSKNECILFFAFPLSVW